MPGLSAASLVSKPPFGRFGSASATVQAEGGSAGAAGPPTEAEVTRAGPRYFESIGIPVVAGRDFNERDRAGSSPVGMLSEGEARRLFGSAQAAIGQGILVNEDGQRFPRLEIVGVVRDERRDGPSVASRIVYVPSMQVSPMPAMTLVVRASSPGALTSMKKTVQDVARKIDPALPMTEVRAGEDHADSKLGAVRLTAEVSMLLGLVALTLAGLGLYGVVSYAVSTRTREIGIRLALGAHPGSVRRLIVRDGLLLASVGVALGIGGSLLLTPVLQSFLIDLPANDPATFGAVSVALAIIALAACDLPARRATTIHPIATLRVE